MATNKELLEKQKELKAIIRELKTQIEVLKPNAEELPNESFCMVNSDDGFYFYELKIDPKTNEIAILDNYKLKTKDRAIITQVGRQHIISLLMGKNRKDIRRR